MLRFWVITPRADGAAHPTMYVLDLLPLLTRHLWGGRAELASQPLLQGSHVFIQLVEFLKTSQRRHRQIKPSQPERAEIRTEMCKNGVIKRRPTWLLFPSSCGFTWGAAANSLSVDPFLYLEESDHLLVRGPMPAAAPATQTMGAALSSIDLKVGVRNTMVVVTGPASLRDDTTLSTLSQSLL